MFQFTTVVYLPYLILLLTSYYWQYKYKLILHNIVNKLKHTVKWLIYKYSDLLSLFKAI